jgi:ribonuclease BN (tRNA processing enzyme)
VVGPPGTAKYVASAAQTASLVTGRPRRGYGEPLEVPVLEVDDGDVSEYAGYTVRTVEVPHAPYLVCQARRIEAGGKVLVFSGDTRADPETMVPLAEGADVLIHEAWSNPGMERWTRNANPRQALAIRRAFETQHALADTVGRIAHEAGVRTLVLTHLNPGERAEELIDTVRAHFGGQVVVPVDRAVLAV